MAQPSQPPTFDKPLENDILMVLRVWLTDDNQQIAPGKWARRTDTDNARWPIGPCPDVDAAALLLIGPVHLHRCHQILVLIHAGPFFLAFDLFTQSSLAEIE